MQPQDLDKAFDALKTYDWGTDRKQMDPIDEAVIATRGDAEARKALEILLTEEAKIDTAARLKIANQRKIIVEGSQEWEILYRKYYNDEVRKLGI